MPISRYRLGRLRAVGAVSLVAIVGLGLAAPASAQIYSWRDANGHLVLSNVRSGSSSASPSTRAKASPAPKAASARAVRAVTPSSNRLYDYLIDEHAKTNGVRTDLVRAVVQVESAFNPYAKSPKGALGLMQLMPMTIQQFGVRNPFNPIENLSAGVAYLRQLLDRYNNNEELALAAYNAGPGAVDRHNQSVPPYRETKDYVLRINKMAPRPVVQKHGTKIYRTTEIVDGRPVSHYSDQKPPSAGYDVIAAR